ncbi:response regulator transcription factor [Clostridium butyricum]|uniref:Stage 0 sporulation protein A homolog n=1 Tax=Clostridium butyricum E4 str. BoNT E BL5262 TaxID=632245 RepID=C4IMH0_CLOBU|nr:response regulator transcription factor [Clostridium butyricum]EDT73722.1 DNA-binding response regulator [Clostridium butyricum 5521]EEP52483.1 two component transcriptional regulator, winged helix family [Clostridium butyricum E4 str. BoNT E BL5262]NFL31095.1 response regulator transcription factor [Clostridium butyricum]NFS19336.1 response regulator transcription factor [Clostridium butyricum]QUF83426.1 response regulator transcription factor [Clostridium butyricum]
MVKILVVEDNIEISKNIEEYFQKEFEITAVYNGADALDNLQIYNYDVVILDLMLPEVGGMTVLKYISDKCLNTGVIILTAKEELGDKLKAFNLGANDYLTKPFFMEELKARINAILKSMGKVKTANILEFKDLKIDMKTKKIFIEDNEIELNEKLYKLLEYLVLNKGVLLFKEQIFDNICGYNSDAATEIIEVYISRLRKQLNSFGYGKYLVTKRGMGYILDESADD